jgi:hypothetical protein
VGAVALADVAVVVVLFVVIKVLVAIIVRE